MINQLLRISKYFPSKEDFYITAEWEPNVWAKDYPNALYLFDEGEQLIEKNLLDLQDDGFHGLYSMKGKRIFLFSATLDDYWGSSFKRVFELSEDAVLTFPTSHQVRTGDVLAQKIECFVYQ